MYFVTNNSFNASINHITLTKWKKMWQEIRFVELYAKRLKQLTYREMRIFEMMARGTTVNDIAEKLDVKPLTVRKHRRNIFDKLGVKDSMGLFYYANCFDLLEAAVPDETFTQEMLDPVEEDINI